MLAALLLCLAKAIGVCLASLVCLYAWFRVRKFYRGCGGSRRLPGPPTLPFVGNLLTFLRHKRNTLPLFQQWADEYGHTYRFTVLGDRDIILVNDPESIKHVLSTKFREGVYGKGAYQQEQYRDLIGMGIFNSNPPLWKQQRKCAAPLFAPAALKSHGRPYSAMQPPHSRRSTAMIRWLISSLSVGCLSFSRRVPASRQPPVR